MGPGFHSNAGTHIRAGRPRHVTAELRRDSDLPAICTSARPGLSPIFLQPRRVSTTKAFIAEHGGFGVIRCESLAVNLRAQFNSAAQIAGPNVAMTLVRPGVSQVQVC